eukprot:42768-Pelagomonas_calceolata.AAC.3
MQLEGWKPVDVGEDFLLGAEEGGFAGLEVLEDTSIIDPSMLEDGKGCSCALNGLKKAGQAHEIMLPTCCACGCKVVWLVQGCKGWLGCGDAVRGGCLGRLFHLWVGHGDAARGGCREAVWGGCRRAIRGGCRTLLEKAVGKLLDGCYGSLLGGCMGCLFPQGGRACQFDLHHAASLAIRRKDIFTQLDPSTSLFEIPEKRPGQANRGEAALAEDGPGGGSDAGNGGKASQAEGPEALRARIAALEAELKKDKKQLQQQQQQGGFEVVVGAVFCCATCEIFACCWIPQHEFGLVGRMLRKCLPFLCVSTLCCNQPFLQQGVQAVPGTRDNPLSYKRGADGVQGGSHVP